MFVVNVSPDIIDKSQKQVENYNFGQRYTANGTKEQQLTGIVGQNVVLDILGMDLVDGGQGFDGGIDLVINNLKIDVKTMGRTTSVKKSYTNNFLKLQDYFDTDIYIFCSYHKNLQELTICGWIDKKSFVQKRKFYPKGSERNRLDGTTFLTFADLYEIDMVDLYDVDSVEDLKKQLEKPFE